MAQTNHLVLMLVVGSFIYYTKASDCSHDIVHVKIDPNNGNDTDSCITGYSSCKSLEWAFRKDHRKNCTNYVLEVGTHLLQSRTDNFEGYENLAFSGNTSNSSEVEIFCTEENTGLGFFQVSNLTISNLTLTICSSVRNSSSRDYSVDQTYQSLKFQVGLYFYLCNDISMQSVIVKNSPSATGVVMYDTGGTNQITDCQFYNNSVFYPDENTASPYGGGGGLYVEFTYCKPGSTDCDKDDVSQKITRSKYQFTRCTFKNNLANDSTVNPLVNYIVPSKSNHMAFGRGGGLSIFVNGDSHSNTFDVVNCSFSGNKAAWGGGMFLEFHDKTYNNSISVVNSKFTSNKCHYTQDSGTAGGGMRMGFYEYENVPGIGNNVNIDSCDFEDNSALNGGGLSISAALHNVSKENLAKVTVTNGIFLTNIARLGSALHIDGFPLFLVGQMLTVHVIECSFYENSVNYLEPLGLEEKVPYQPGEGTVYIHGVPVDFQQFISFNYNKGSGLAIVKAEVDFSNSVAWFNSNIGNRGGGIALLGAAYIVINDNTSMLFYNNTAAISGGAIYSKYISRRTLGIYADCFVRHTNPVLHANDWNANFTFQLNRDLGGSTDNAIYTTSLLPCSWAGKNQSGIFCWKGWVFKDKDDNIFEDCTELISSDIGSIKFNQSQSQSNHYKSFPGQPFNLHLDIKDDRGYDVKEQTVFLASTNSSGFALGTNGDLYSYIWGTNATVWGESGSNITLQLDSVQNREWHLKLFLELQPCPPGFILTNISLSGNNSAHAVDLNNTKSQLHSCSCSGDYGRSVICDKSYYSARLANGYWMGYIDPKNHTYVSGPCPAGFCVTDQKYSHFFLPNNSKDLEEKICRSMNRKGILCGECIDGYGPAVNSRTYECVNCTDPVGDTFKYVSATYIPLFVIFLIIILFKIRLTIGAANAFILYAQVISSTFSIDAGGQTPLNLIAGKHTNSLLKAYRITYGIFNLEFFENLIPPLCVGTELNALAVISLDYAVALAPLVMIVVVAIIFRISTCIRDRCCNTWFRQSRASSRAQSFIAKKTRSLSESMLPAFSAFLLLSYTKFALTPSYILNQVILVDNNGKKIFPPRASYAGYLPINDRGYILHYVLPACIVLATFVVIPPLLLLDYPLRLFEWGLSKVEFLWRLYPVGKIHFILDTFQGCFKNKYRFFAGLYFVFRLVVNINFSFALTWLDQFMIQEIVCILMIMLVSIFQPYNEQNEIFNRIDVLIFTNLAIVNGLSIYLYEYSVNNPKADTLPASAFVIEYILVFLPLIYIIGYILWENTKPYHKKLPCCKYYKRSSMNRDLSEQSCDTLPPNNAPSLLESKSYRNERRFDESEELLFQRAKVVNLYRPPNQRVMVNESQEKKVVASTKQTNVSESPSLRLVVSGSGNNYGSTGSSTKESSGASIHSTNSSV